MRMPSWFSLVHGVREVARSSTYEEHVVQHTVHPRPLFSARQFSEKDPAFTESALDEACERKSSLRLVAGNGQAPAILRIGRRVLIDEEAFFLWLSRQGEMS